MHNRRPEDFLSKRKISFSHCEKKKAYLEMVAMDGVWNPHGYRRRSCGMLPTLGDCTGALCNPGRQSKERKMKFTRVRMGWRFNYAD